MKSNSKDVKTALRNHINEFIDPSEYDNCNTVKEALRSQINHMKYGVDTDYTSAYRMVEGGGFLIYTDDINNFIISLNLNNNSNKNFDDMDTFKLYCHLIAREIECIIK